MKEKKLIEEISYFALLRKILEENIGKQDLLQCAITRCSEDKEYLTLFGITPKDGESSNQKDMK